MGKWGWYRYFYGFDAAAVRRAVIEGMDASHREWPVEAGSSSGPIGAPLYEGSDLVSISYGGQNGMDMKRYFRWAGEVIRAERAVRKAAYEALLEEICAQRSSGEDVLNLADQN